MTIPDHAIVKLIAAFLKDRDESVMPDETSDEERMEFAAAILMMAEAHRVAKEPR